MNPGTFLKVHSPVLLAGAAIVLIVGAVASAIATAPKAAEEVKDIQEKAKKLDPENSSGEDSEETPVEGAIDKVSSNLPEPARMALDRVRNLTVVRNLRYPEYRTLYFDAAKVLGKRYLPTLAMAAGAVVCVIFSQKASAVKYAAAMGMLSTTAGRYDRVRDKIRKVLGEEEAVGLDRDILKEEAEEKFSDSDMTLACGEIEDTGDGDILFWEPITGKYFYSSTRALQDALTKASRIRERKDISFNKLLALMGLEGIPNGNELGWKKSQSLIDFWFHNNDIEVDDDTRPLTIIDWITSPTYI